MGQTILPFNAWVEHKSPTHLQGNVGLNLSTFYLVRSGGSFPGTKNKEHNQEKKLGNIKNGHPAAALEPFPLTSIKRKG